MFIHLQYTVYHCYVRLVCWGMHKLQIQLYTTHEYSIDTDHKIHLYNTYIQADYNNWLQWIGGWDQTILHNHSIQKSQRRYVWHVFSHHSSLKHRFQCTWYNCSDQEWHQISYMVSLLSTVKCTTFWIQRRLKVYWKSHFRAFVYLFVKMLFKCSNIT